MVYFFTNDIKDFILEYFENQANNFAYFGIGLLLGVILFFAVLFIIYNIAKRKPKIKEREITSTNNEYQSVINYKLFDYNQEAINLPIKEKAIYIGKTILSMMEDIAKLYYPDSKDPLFEISLDQLVDFLEYSANRINYIIDNLLANNLKFIDPQIKYSLKDKKISFVVEMINKNKQKEMENDREPLFVEENKKKEGLFAKLKGKVIEYGKQAALKYSQSVLDKEFEEIIQEIGEDFNKLYTNQKLEFNDVSKKEEVIKNTKRNSLIGKIIKKVGGFND